MKHNLFINKKKWSTFSHSELEDYKCSVFEYFRKSGFPYFPTDEVWRKKEITKAFNYDASRCIDEDNKEIRQTMHGLSLCWSYHPHHYSVICNDKKTVHETFLDDDKLKAVIAKRIKMGDNMSNNGLRKMLKIFSGVQCVSNFRPTAASAIYKRFAPSGGVVYDMSSGYGGRIIGALLAGVKYYGVEPCEATFKANKKIISDFGIDAELKCEGSEVGGWLDDNSVDLCFTSPPYFNCEKYSDETTQSYMKYPTKDLWLNGFIKDTLLDCKRVVRANGKIIINIANVPNYKTLVDDVIGIANLVGLRHVDTWGLQLSRLGRGGIKTEPILILIRGFRPPNRGNENENRETITKLFKKEVRGK